MSEITEIRISVGGTESTGNYSNVRLDISQTIQLAPGDDPAAVQAAATEQLQLDLLKLFNKALQERRQDAKYPVEPLFIVLFNWRLNFIAILPNLPQNPVLKVILDMGSNSQCIRTEGFISVCVDQINEGFDSPFTVFDLRNGGSVQPLLDFVAQVKISDPSCISEFEDEE